MLLLLANTYDTTAGSSETNVKVVCVFILKYRPLLKKSRLISHTKSAFLAQSFFRRRRYFMVNKQTAFEFFSENDLVSYVSRYSNSIILQLAKENASTEL